jgi:hypothetical protein
MDGLRPFVDPHPQLACSLPVQHHAVPARIRPALFDEFDETIDRRGLG